jgi:oxidase EvaA
MFKTTIELKNSLAFLKSALTLENKFLTTNEVVNWLKQRNEEVDVDIQRIDFDQMKDWNIDRDQVKLSHKSGRFFSIEGINVQTNWGGVSSWDQPIINQPEIGFLGILTKEFNGVLHFLMQAKIEPGNINYVQLSPTLQATKSNYSKVHKGKSPRYLEYFLDRDNNEILLDQLQSEQGARFLKKRNRNIIIKVSGEVDVHEDFCWLTLGQIKELMNLNNVVNMDTRTVISGIQFGNYSANTINLYALMKDDISEVRKDLLISELNSENSLYSFNHIIHWFTELKAQYDLEVNRIPLKNVNNWTIEKDCIKHIEGKYFEVIAVNVTIGNREVTSWNQPLVAPTQEGICAFIIKKINGIYHFLVQAKLESGNFDILEMAPTVQCITGSYSSKKSLTSLPYLEYVLTAKKENILFDTLQSEEGGRFYKEQNRNLIIIAGDEISVDAPPNYTWMTLNQLKTFIQFNNYLNIQSRSLISAIAFI